MNNLFIQLQNEALKSNMCHQLAACVIIEGKIINKPYCNCDRNYCRGNIGGSIHAEANALLHYYGRNLKFNKYKKKWYLFNNSNKKISIIVIRMTKNNNNANARPCQNCLEMMKDLNVNKVYYSTGNGDEIICESVKNMISIQLSKYLLVLTNKNPDYFENLLIKKFPSEIKEKNLLYFIEHNFKNVLPDCSYVIQYKNNNKIIIFYNKNKKYLLESIIY